MDRDAFDSLTASVDTSLIIVTAAADEERAGCLVGFHAQSSIEPGRYCVWLSKANHTYRVALRSTHLGVHFLTADDLALASLFGEHTGDDQDKFTDVPATSGPGGAPVITACPHRVVLRRTALLDEGGDHVCIAGEVVVAESTGRFSPLRLSQASQLTPGHEAEERHGPATERAG